MEHPDNKAGASPVVDDRGGLILLGRFASVLSNMAAGIAVLCMTLMTLLVLTNILVGLLSRFSRSLPNSLSFTWEYSGYLMGVAFLMGMALALKNDSHIRLRVLIKKSDRPLAYCLELFCTVVGTFLCAYLTFALFQSSYSAWAYDRLSLASLTPLWIPKAGLALGAAVLTFQMLIRFLFALTGRLSDCPKTPASLQKGV